MKADLSYITQIALTALSSAFAILSFLNSSLYQFASQYFDTLLYNIPQGITGIVKSNTIIEYALILFFLLIIIIDIYKENFAYIFRYNILLFLPEALSCSEINFFNFLNLSPLFQPRREIVLIFITGLIIVTCYNIVTFISTGRELMRNYSSKGVRSEVTSFVLSKQTKYSLLLGGATLLVTILIVIFNSFSSVLLSPLATVVPYKYFFYSALSIAFIIMGLFFFLYDKLRASGQRNFR